MAKKYIGTNPLYVKTKDITEIDKIICAELNVGDLVVLEDENGEATKSYRVAKKTMADGMHLVFADTEHVEDVVYAYEDNVWVYDETIETELGGGGTKLYKHKVSFEANTQFGDISFDLTIFSTESRAVSDIISQGEEITFESVASSYISGDMNGTIFVSYVRFNDDYTFELSALFIGGSPLQSIYIEDAHIYQNEITDEVSPL